MGKKKRGLCCPAFSYSVICLLHRLVEQIRQTSLSIIRTIFFLLWRLLGVFGGFTFFEVILNICVVINLIPTTGITLPFLSYGGTSVVLLMAEIMIALSVSKAIRFRRPEQDLWGEMVRSSGRREK